MTNNSSNPPQGVCSWFWNQRARIQFFSSHFLMFLFCCLSVSVPWEQSCFFFFLLICDVLIDSDIARNLKTIEGKPLQIPQDSEWRALSRRCSGSGHSKSFMGVLFPFLNHSLLCPLFTHKKNIVPVLCAKRSKLGEEGMLRNRTGEKASTLIHFVD